MNYTKKQSGKDSGKTNFSAYVLLTIQIPKHYLEDLEVLVRLIA